MRFSPVRAVSFSIAALICIACAVRSSAEEARPQVRLLLKADVAATLIVDGVPTGEVSAGEIRVVSLPRGVHRVALLTRGGELRWEDSVLLEGAQVVRLVELAARVAQHRSDYARVPAGSFVMGCVTGDTQCAADEQLRLTVPLGSFWIMRTEVTVAAYEAVAGKLPVAPAFNEDWKRDTYPIVNVTWDEAAAYCAHVGGRLPAEAEWEYAARGGRADWIYVWGNAPKPVVDGRKQANVADQRARGAFDVAHGPWFEDYDDGYVYASPAFTFSPNGFELFDMAGDVREWCADWYGAGEPDALGPAPAAARVLRGGSWKVGTSGMRVSARSGLAPNEISPDVGLRCVRDVVVP